MAIENITCAFFSKRNVNLNNNKHLHIYTHTHTHMHISCLSVIGVIARYQRTAAKNEGQQHKFLRWSLIYFTHKHKQQQQQQQQEQQKQQQQHTKRVTLIKIAGK